MTSLKPSAVALLQRIAACVGGALGLVAPPLHAQAVNVYHGLCDASAAVALDAQHFVVAGDEDNTLRVYRRGRSDAVATLPLKSFLGTDKESDLEGSARIGERIYWIASHGRNSSGKLRPDRYRFFATDIDASQPVPALRPAGKASASLLEQLLTTEQAKALRLDEAARLAPEADGGLNIEGLAEGADGGLLIGLRNPLRGGKALVIPLHNPAEVLAGQPARFGRPLLLDLAGRGVRSLERVGDGYLVVAGPTADRGDFALYRWSGGADDAPQALPQPLHSLRPEALLTWPDGMVQLLSDDGGVVSDGVACKDRPAAQQRFRSVELRLR